ncbi:SPX domain-containing membrane protein OsI_17046-like isoform X3 [Dioscorea cayenensis subsp. rotundata]|uniref:SPX domain-containing membrane protein OsI_17046-like isoform X3 n=1 Tax=Dioscorea cayennensis subsp. rotundata TaxID=55577 RepID=A0AB40ANF5_DIOCR|nr:SPX domain-containing membrane protein OsI_17046-like isoform X3 [Dioscorea cayenensis subsp. rotundata]
MGFGSADHRAGLRSTWFPSDLEALARFVDLSNLKMVNFGKRLMQDQVQEWKEYYINYKLMKKRVKLYVQQTQVDGKDHQQVLKEFSRILDEQVDRSQWDELLAYNGKVLMNLTK